MKDESKKTSKEILKKVDDGIETLDSVPVNTPNVNKEQNAIKKIDVKKTLAKAKEKVNELVKLLKDKSKELMTKIASNKKQAIITLVMGIIIIAIILFLVIKGCTPSYKVAFDSNGGTVVSTLKVKRDNTVKKPKDPTKEGYVFSGWYLDDELFDFNTKITQNIELEARWEEEEKKLSLNLTTVSLSPNASTVLVAIYGGNEELVWSSNDESIVTVDNNGVVKALKIGKATITVATKDGNLKADCLVTVTKDIVKVTGVSITGDNTVTVGKSIKLTAVISPMNASNKGVTWKSSDPSIATVNQSGTVKGIKEGKVSITVTTSDGNEKAMISITVVEEKIKVSKITITGNDEVVMGKTIKLTANIEPENATNKEVIWTSSDDKTATVDKNGNVKGLKTGNVTITASIDGETVTATKIVKVVKNETKISEIKISGPTEVEVDQTITLKAEIKPTNATNQTLNWSSNNSEAASVDQKGVVTGHKAGVKVIITAKATDGSNKSATYEVTVKEKKTDVIPVTSVRINNKSGKNEMFVGDSIDLEAVINPSNATNQSVRWSVNNNHASLSSINTKTTTLKANSSGSVRVTVEVDGESAFIDINIKEKEPEVIPVTSISIRNNTGTTKIHVGETISLTAVIEPGNATDQSVSWTKTNNNVSLNYTNRKDIVVTGVAVGKVTVKVTAGGHDAEIEIEVEEKPKTYEITLQAEVSKTTNLTTYYKVISVEVDGSDLDYKYFSPSRDKRLRTFKGTARIAPSFVNEGDLKTLYIILNDNSVVEATVKYLEPVYVD